MVCCRDEELESYSSLKINKCVSSVTPENTRSQSLPIERAVLLSEGGRWLNWTDGLLIWQRLLCTCWNFSEVCAETCFQSDFHRIFQTNNYKWYLPPNYCSFIVVNKYSVVSKSVVIDTFINRWRERKKIAQQLCCCCVWGRFNWQLALKGIVFSIASQ